MVLSRSANSDGKNLAFEITTQLSWGRRVSFDNSIVHDLVKSMVLTVESVEVSYCIEKGAFILSGVACCPLACETPLKDGNRLDSHMQMYMKYDCIEHIKVTVPV